MRDADEAVPLDPAPNQSMIPSTNPLMVHTSEDLAKLNEIQCDFGAQNDEDSSDNGNTFTSFHKKISRGEYTFRLGTIENCHVLLEIIEKNPFFLPLETQKNPK